MAHKKSEDTTTHNGVKFNIDLINGLQLVDQQLEIQYVILMKTLGKDLQRHTIEE